MPQPLDRDGRASHDATPASQGPVSRAGDADPAALAPVAPAPAAPAPAAPVPEAPRSPAAQEPGTAADDPGIVALAAALDEDPMFVSRTVRSFVRDGRLVTIPARERRKRVVLRWLRDAAFPDDGEWLEPDVNERIARVHGDTAALRRYMVEARLLVRDGGRYRRGPA